MLESTPQEQEHAQKVLTLCAVDLEKLSELDRRLLRACIAAALTERREQWVEYAEHRASCEIVTHENECTCGLRELQSGLIAPVE